MKTTTKTTELKLDGKEYVILPKAEYLRLRRGDTPPRTVDAIEYASASIGGALRAARETKGLTQVELAEKLGKSQTMVARAEAGALSVGEKYAVAVLEACGLPKDWKPGKVGTRVPTSKGKTP
jgi:ribosome-binding protein aMBF1 (putative translation factor)